MTEIRYLTADLTIKEIKRIFASIEIDATDPTRECWEWTGSKDRYGYGLLWFKRRVERVHRVLYAWLVQPIPRYSTNPRTLVLDHLCENKSCCNPAHLQLVPHRTNVLRGNGPSADNARKTHCKRGHLLDKHRRKACPICDSERHKARLRGAKREHYLELARKASQRYRDKHKK